jgi:streptogramin lyase
VRLLVWRPVLVAGLIVLAWGLVGSVASGDPAPLLTEYPVPGSPLNVVVESPGRVWFTLPAQDAVGRLVVTSTTE